MGQAAWGFLTLPVRVRGEDVLGGAASPPGHRLGLLELFLVRGQQLFDHLRYPGDLGVETVDAAEHGLQQGGLVPGEGLRAFQCLFQLGDLAAGPGAGQLGECLGVALAGDEVVYSRTGWRLWGTRRQRPVACEVVGPTGGGHMALSALGGIA